MENNKISQKVKKMKVKEKLKRYFTEKPKQNFWFHAFITLFLFRYVGPTMIMFLIFFQVGLVVPEADVSKPIEMASENLVEAFMKPMQVLFDAGANIGTNNPIVAKVLFFVLSNFIYVVWLAAIVLILNLLRYAMAWIYRKVKK